MNLSEEQRRFRLICIVLGISTFFVYCRSVGNDFIIFDDFEYVLTNWHVRNGLTLGNILWAFTTGRGANWHPLTWISHMMDCQLYGVAHPGGHHLTNVLFHVANTVLLFVVLQRMTGRLWRSAIVAALFALHPLHVESVAWISERKDVLSMLFGLLTFLAYFKYVQQTKANEPEARKSYLLVLVWFALGLMSKPMLVTLPFVLLLMDFWPLGRAFRPGWKQLVVEKAPMFAMSAISCVVTSIVQKRTISSLQYDPLTSRIENACEAYVRYLGKLFWPSKMAILYPLEVVPTWVWIGSAALLVMISLVAFLNARQRPWFFVGWFWFLGTLVPVIGLVQVGRQAMADRYTYLPSIGIFIIVVWGTVEVVKRLPALRSPLISVGSAALCILAWMTVVQQTYWKNNETLFTHALQVVPPNAAALDNRATGLELEGRYEEAMDDYKLSLKIDPTLTATWLEMGLNMAARKDYDDAVKAYQKALSLQDDPTIHYNYGNVLSAQGKFAEAEKQYRLALKGEPDGADTENNLGAVLLRLGKPDEAMMHFEHALKLRPDFPEAHDQLASLLQKRGKLDLARYHYAEAVRLKPDFTHARLRLGLMMAEGGDVAGSIPQFEAVTRLEPTNADAYFDLGAAYAALENWPSAVDAFSIASHLKPGSAEIQRRLAEAQSKAK